MGMDATDVAGTCTGVLCCSESTFAFSSCDELSAGSALTEGLFLIDVFSLIASANTTEIFVALRCRNHPTILIIVYNSARKKNTINEILEHDALITLRHSCLEHKGIISVFFLVASCTEISLATILCLK